MNTRQKGWRIANKCKIKLQEMGWLVGKVELGGKFTKVKDLFGLYDFCCVKGTTVLFVQVTCNRPHTHKKYIEFAIEHGCENIWIEQWVWIDFKGWKRWVYYPNGIKQKQNV